MMSSSLLVIAGIIFNAGIGVGGFLWLFKNHLPTIVKQLETICKRLGDIEQRVSRIEGRLNGDRQ